MNNLSKFAVLKDCWKDLYGENSKELLNDFISELKSQKSIHTPNNYDWVLEDIDRAAYILHTACKVGNIISLS